MNNTPSDPDARMYIGPEGSSFNQNDPNPSDLLDDARETIRQQDEDNKESTKLAKRLIVAFILIAVLGVVFYIVLPQYGLKLNPLVPVASFAAILIGALLSAHEDAKSDPESPHYEDPNNPNRSPKDDDGCSDGCAVGMCPGPRPLRMFRDPPRKPPSKN